MKKVLLVVPPMEQPGGLGAVLAWTLEALRVDHRVSVLSVESLRTNEVNRFFGTHLQSSDFEMHTLSLPLRVALRFLGRCTRLKYAFVLRQCKLLRDQCDVVVSIGEPDLGFPCIKYISSPSLNFPAPQPGNTTRWYQSMPLISRLYTHVCGQVAGVSSRRDKQNLTLVNSQWTGKIIAELYGIETRTIYPPVPGGYLEIPWDEREDGFVCISRFSPEKELERVISILAEVRDRGRDVTLHLVGGIWDRRYYRRICHFSNEGAAWIRVHANLDRSQLIELVSRQRYGIHGMQEEHFGISIAEIAKAGCIMFVPNGGGQVEIVDDPRLTYNTPKSARDKILRVLDDRKLQASLRTQLCLQAQNFSTERFVRELREVVRRF